MTRWSYRRDLLQFMFRVLQSVEDVLREPQTRECIKGHCCLSRDPCNAPFVSQTFARTPKGDLILPILGVEYRDISRLLHLDAVSSTSYHRARGLQGTGNMTDTRKFLQ